jgi:hypothetical protein
MYTRTVPKEIKDMLHKIALENGYDYKVVEDVYFHEFEFITKQMAKGEKKNHSTYENILIKHFGSFIANEKHINKLIEINNAKENKDITISE